MTSAGPIDLSVVLPSFRGGPYVADSIASLRRSLDDAGLTWEAIVVDDGAGDVTLPAGGQSEHVRLIRFPRNCGKGAAVKAGMLAATGRVRAYTDVDLPYGTTPLLAAHHYIADKGFHAVVGDRSLPTSRYAQEINAGRRILSSVFSSFVARVVAPGYFDTQCGFKALRGDIAEAIYRLTRVNRFAQDLELVYLLLVYRLDVKRIPVQMERANPSTVRALRDASRMLWDTVGIQIRRHRGRYADAWLQRRICDEFAERFPSA